MRIQHNIMAMSAYRNYTNNVSAMKKNGEAIFRFKINRAGDRRAGLAIFDEDAGPDHRPADRQKERQGRHQLGGRQRRRPDRSPMILLNHAWVELATQSANGTYDNTTPTHAL